MEKNLVKLRSILRNQSLKHSLRHTLGWLTGFVQSRKYPSMHWWHFSPAVWCLQSSHTPPLIFFERRKRCWENVQVFECRLHSQAIRKRQATTLNLCDIRNKPGTQRFLLRQSFTTMVGYLTLTSVGRENRVLRTSCETGNTFLTMDTFGVMATTQTNASRSSTRLAVEIDVEHARWCVIIALTSWRIQYIYIYIWICTKWSIQSFILDRLG